MNSIFTVIFSPSLPQFHSISHRLLLSTRPPSLSHSFPPNFTRPPTLQHTLSSFPELFLFSLPLLLISPHPSTPLITPTPLSLPHTPPSLSTSLDGIVYVYDALEDFRLSAKLHGHTESILSMDLAMAGMYIVTYGVNGEILVWQSSTNTMLEGKYNEVH